MVSPGSRFSSIRMAPRAPRYPGMAGSAWVAAEGRKEVPIAPETYPGDRDCQHSFRDIGVNCHKPFDNNNFTAEAQRAQGVAGSRSPHPSRVPTGKGGVNSVLVLPFSAPSAPLR